MFSSPVSATETPTFVVRRAHERGHADHGWLNTHHTFSFANYYDPAHMGFRSLRVINDDRVRGGAGFPTHPHRDMEIISYVLEGALEHRDSMGNGSVIRPGDVQRMTAGTGVLHSEYNHSKAQGLRFLQIWILPDRQGLTPGYEQRAFTPEDRHGRLRLVASPDAADGSVTVHQDLRLYSALLDPGQTVTHPFAPGRHGWLQVATGAVRVGDITLHEGDGLSITGADSIEIAGEEAGEILLFDLA